MVAAAWALLVQQENWQEQGQRRKQTDWSGTLSSELPLHSQSEGSAPLSWLESALPYTKGKSKIFQTISHLYANRILMTEGESSRAQIQQTRMMDNHRFSDYNIVVFEEENLKNKEILKVCRLFDFHHAILGNMEWEQSIVFGPQQPYLIPVHFTPGNMCNNKYNIFWD